LIKIDVLEGSDERALPEIGQEAVPSIPYPKQNFQVEKEPKLAVTSIE